MRAVVQDSPWPPEADWTVGGPAMVSNSIDIVMAVPPVRLGSVRLVGGVGKLPEGDVARHAFEVVGERRPHLVFMLWGAHAQSKAKLIDATRHLMLKSVHPSPLSAHRGFIGCGHFSQANEILQALGGAPINWST